MTASAATWTILLVVDKIIASISQGSIPGPLLFNTFLNDVFFFLKDTSLENYAINYLRQDFSILSNWFYNNYMLLNTGSIASCYLVSKIMSNLN